MIKQHANDNQGSLMQKIGRQKLAVSAIALLTAFSTTSVAWATIDNTVTATGSSPTGTNDVTDTDQVQVDVEDADPQVVATKVATRIDRQDGNGFVAIADPDTVAANAGDVIEYTYTFLNDGNVTINNISLTDAVEGGGAVVQQNDETLTDNAPANDPTDEFGDSSDVTAGDGTWSVLAPGDLVTFTSQYTVTQTNFDTNGEDGDGLLSNTVTFAATPAAGTIPPTDLEVTESIGIAQDASLVVTKSADDTTDVVVGQIITYTYVVENTGNVPISNISVTDDVTNGSGGDPTPVINPQAGDNASGNSTDDGADNIYDLLQPGDTITYTGTYVVTQDDVDTLQ